MKIGHILVVHSIDPSKLFASIPLSDDAVWCVYHHGQTDALAKRLSGYLENRRGGLTDYRANRGLARSWNEGIKNSLDVGCEAVMLLNDDLFFYPGCYEKFLTKVKEIALCTPEVALISANGYESGGPHIGEVHNQGYSCCVLLRQVIDRIGYFDEIFWPAYFEDVDYARRIHLSNMKTVLDERVLVEHERSSTLRSSVEIQREHHQQFCDNKERFERKWGLNGIEYFSLPYNDPNSSLYLPSVQEQRAI